jgi:hypothetical protein
MGDKEADTSDLGALTADLMNVLAYIACIFLP